MTDPMHCARCGRPHARCSGHKDDGSPCGNRPMKGQRVCRMHGGSSPQAKAAAAQRLALAAVQADAARALAQEALSPLSDPLDELARLAAEAIGWKDALAARVNALTEIRYAASGPVGTEQLRAEVVLFERALDRAAKFVDLLARHDWIGKRMELDQGQANIVIGAVGTALDAVSGLSVEQRGQFIDGFLAAIGRVEAAGSAGGVVVGEVEG